MISQGSAGDWVAYNSRAYGSSVALADVDRHTSMTWAQVEARVARFAGLLAKLRIGEGQRVALIAENSPDMFVLQFACMRLGAVLVPLNWRLARPELLELCADAEPALVIHDEVWAETGVVLAEALDVPRLAWGPTTASPQVDDLLETVQGVPPGRRPIDAPTHILYTSGTTGRPKGVIVTWATLLGQYLNIASVDSISSASNFLSPLPLFHAGSLNVLANPILLSGGCVSIARRFDAGQVLSAIAAKERPVTHHAGIPLIYQEIVSHPAFGATDLSGLRHAQIAGGGTSRPVLEALREKGVVLQPHYGASETGPAVTAMSVEEARQEYPANAIGRAVLHSGVRVVDAGGADVPDGTDGEIWVKGPSVTPGYWKLDPALAFTDGWYRTGDGACRDSDGRYFYRDRLKAMYKSGGENVYPAEVERVLEGMPAIAEATVLGVPDGRWGEVGCAVVVAAGEATPTLAEVTEYCRGSLAGYKIPKHLILVDELPRNVTGKVNKAALMSLYQGGNAG